MEGPVKGRVGVRSQEAPGAEARAVQCSPRRTEFRTQGRVPGRIRLCSSRQHNSMSAWSRKPQKSSLAAVTGMGNDMVSFQIPYRVTLQTFWTPDVWCCQTLGLGPHGETALARVRFRSRDVTRAEATLVRRSVSRPEMSAHATGRLKWRVKFRGRLRFRWRVPTRVGLGLSLDPRSSRSLTHSKSVVSLKV